MEVYGLNPGNGITGVIPPEGFDIGALQKRLDADFGIQIAEGLGPLKGTIFRIGHVGHVTDAEVDYFVKSFRTCLS
jgi:aspartate aminotransferase-like enzyme